MFFALLFVFSAVLQLFLPWWVCGPLCFVMAMGWNTSPRQSFLLCGLSQSLLWAILIVYMDLQNHHILSRRLAAMLHLPNHFTLMASILLACFLLNGLAGMAGALVREAFLPAKTYDEL